MMKTLANSYLIVLRPIRYINFRKYLADMLYVYLNTLIICTFKQYLKHGLGICGKFRSEADYDIEELVTAKKITSRRAVAEKVEKTRSELVIEAEDKKIKFMRNLALR